MPKTVSNYGLNVQEFKKITNMRAVYVQLRIIKGGRGGGGG